MSCCVCAPSPSYTAPEKVQIAKRHLVPRQLEEHGLKKREVKFPDNTLKKLIQDYTHEAGVRQLEREIGSLTRKVARKIVSSRSRGGMITITPDSLPKYLGHPEFTSDVAEKITECGIAMGLAWTPVGGEILFSIGGGALVVVIGLWLFKSRIVGQSDHFHVGSHSHGHGHSHSHGDGHEHSHGMTPEQFRTVSWPRLILLGISGGIVPCWGAILWVYRV